MNNNTRRVDRPPKEVLIEYLGPKSQLHQMGLIRCGLFIELQQGPVIGPFCAMVQESRFLRFVGMDGAQYEFRGDNQIEFDDERYGDFNVHHGLPIHLRERCLTFEEATQHMKIV